MNEREVSFGLLTTILLICLTTGTCSIADSLKKIEVHMAASVSEKSKWK